MMTGLEKHGHIALRRRDDGEIDVRLTECGRQTVVELVAVSKVVEEDALAQIDYSEAHMLKHLLKRVIRNAGNEMPGLWKTDKAA
jgi:3-hydroxy-9,10-secoandrosta-1,3,5(10)-triene-9,17-dione monooxygenase reductase component